jgi:hypothetical protein
MSLHGVDLDRGAKGFKGNGSDLDRKYWVAMALFVVLAVLVWFTIGEGKVLVFGRPVEMRLVPLVVIGGLALRTVLARQAEKIRRGRDESDEGGSQTPRDSQEG